MYKTKQKLLQINLYHVKIKIMGRNGQLSILKFQIASSLESRNCVFACPQAVIFIDLSGTLKKNKDLFLSSYFETLY